MTLVNYVCVTAMFFGGGAAVRSGFAQQQSLGSGAQQAQPNASQMSQQQAAPFPASGPSSTATASQNGGAAAQFWFGLASEKIPPAIARQLKLSPNQGLMIVTVFQDSAAARAGLHADDLLIEINGKPLTDSEQLTAAADAPMDVVAKNGPAPGAARPATLVFLRDGDPHTVAITPAPRPKQLQIVNADAASQPPKTENAATFSQQNMTNYAIPGGNSLQVGPGYVIDLQSKDAYAIATSRAIQNGKSVILSTETDSAGNTRNTISQDNKTYTVEAGHLDRLPENLRGLGQQLLDAARPQQNAANPPAADMAGQLAEDEKRIKGLELQMETMRREMENLRPPAAAPAPAHSVSTGGAAPR